MLNLTRLLPRVFLVLLITLTMIGCSQSAASAGERDPSYVAADLQISIGNLDLYRSLRAKQLIMGTEKKKVETFKFKVKEKYLWPVSAKGGSNVMLWLYVISAPGSDAYYNYYEMASREVRNDSISTIPDKIYTVGGEISIELHREDSASDN